MCRWFAFISPSEPCLLSDVLITPANAISKQISDHYLPFLLPHHKDKELGRSHDAILRARNALLNMDGMGIAWYTNAAESYNRELEGTRPALYKSASPPISDFNFRNLCDNTDSNCLFAHIRATSGTAVTQVNCHPFVFGRHIFMHNGVISNIHSIKRDLCDLLAFDTYCNISGSTDSEHAAALYMTNLTNSGGKAAWQKTYPIQDMVAALTKTVVQIMQLQKSKLGEKRSPNSINFCTTDGEKLVAFRFRNHATEEPPSLYWSNTAGQKLNGKFPQHPDEPGKLVRTATKSENDTMGRHTIVASEPTTYDEKEWHLIPRNCCFTVDETGLTTQCEIVYDQTLNSEDPEAYLREVAALGH